MSKQRIPILQDIGNQFCAFRPELSDQKDLLNVLGIREKSVQQQCIVQGDFLVRAQRYFASLDSHLSLDLDQSVPNKRVCFVLEQWAFPGNIDVEKFVYRLWNRESLTGHKRIPQGPSEHPFLPVPVALAPETQCFLHVQTIRSFGDSRKRLSLYSAL